MREKRHSKSALTMGFVLVVICLFSNPMSGVLFAQSAADWPMWPEPGKRIFELNVKEPATFLSIGREVVPWPFFGETTVEGGFINLVGSHLYFTIEEFTMLEGVKTVTNYRTVKPGATNLDKLFVVSGDTSFPISDFSNQEIIDSLRSRSVFPTYKEGWFTYGTPPNQVFVDNESFQADTLANQDQYVEAWKSLVLEDRNIGTPDFFFADSGHAPPQMIWPFDPWLYSYRTKTGYQSGPVAWEDRYVCMWPTNQGALQVFEALNVDEPDSISYVNRSWLIIPDPAFRQSVFYELRKSAEASGYKRHTLLDGPVTVRDVEIGGQWRRIAIGTTGIGTKQVPKPTGAWVALKQSANNPPVSLPTQTTEVQKGRVFGIYAFDITELGSTLAGQSPNPLWSISNISFNNSALSDSYDKSFLETGSGLLEIQSGDSDHAAYRDILFSVSKPLIGYSRDLNGNRKWHVIILGVEKGTNKFKWIDIDPGNGKIYGSGYFRNTLSNSDEVLTGRTVKDGGTDYVYTGENIEDLYPSRILSAFPPRDSSYDQEPLLSDVYVYLSNGSIYKWDLNPVNSSPTYIVTIRNKLDSNNPVIPLADFDMTYSSGDTYLAANVGLTFSGGAAHDTEALIILNLSNIDPQNIDFSPGSTGDVVDASNPNAILVQLQSMSGAYTVEKKSVLASPVFVAGRLYLAFYELDDKGKTNVSRLYSIDFLNHAASGKSNNPLIEANELSDMDYKIGAEFFDFPEGNEAIMMFIDSQGDLVLIFDNDGTMDTQTISTGLTPFSGGEPGEEGEGSFTNLDIVYWKTM